MKEIEKKENEVIDPEKETEINPEEDKKEIPEEKEKEIKKEEIKKKLQILQLEKQNQSEKENPKRKRGRPTKKEIEEREKQKKNQYSSIYSVLIRTTIETLNIFLNKSEKLKKFQFSDEEIELLVKVWTPIVIRYMTENIDYELYTALGTTAIILISKVKK